MEEQFKQVASLVGDPTRATILWTLLDGRAFTATELAIAASTSPQNISMHLARLVDAGLLRVESQGRHRYYHFSRKEVAYAIEALTHLVPVNSKTIPLPESGQGSVKYCRSCYDHLAGRIGVSIADSLLRQKIVVADDAGNFSVGAKGAKWFAGLDIDIDELKQQRRPLARSCLDWSERRPHIAGSLGAALLNTLLERDWMRRVKQSRAIIITAAGQKKLQDYFRL